MTIADLYPWLRVALFFGIGFVAGFVVCAMLVVSRETDEVAEEMQRWRE